MEKTLMKKNYGIYLKWQHLKKMSLNTPEALWILAQ